MGKDRQDTLSSLTADLHEPETRSRTLILEEQRKRHVAMQEIVLDRARRATSDLSQTLEGRDLQRSLNGSRQVLGKGHSETSQFIGSKATRDVAQQTSNNETSTNPQSPDQLAVTSREGTNDIWTQAVQESRSRHLSLYDLEISAGTRLLGCFNLSTRNSEFLKQAHEITGELRTFTF